MPKRGISSLELMFLEEYIMKQVNCQFVIANV